MIGLSSLSSDRGCSDPKWHSGRDLLDLALAALEVSGIEVDVGLVAALQRPGQKSLHRLVDLLTDSTQLRLGVAALGVNGGNEGLDPVPLACWPLAT